jgi:hypothetical protein
MVTGAVCITMHGALGYPRPQPAPNALLTDGTAGNSRTRNAHAQSTWWSWLFDYWFSK